MTILICFHFSIFRNFKPEFWISDCRLSRTQVDMINKYSCIDLFNRKVFFLNYFFKDIDLCSRSVFFVINEVVIL